jgi:hypothetical protein
MDEALKRTPNDATLHVARAAWLYSVGRLRDASKALELASLLDPLGPAVDGFRASLIAAQGDLQTAQEIVDAAWMRWPDAPFLWHIAWATLCAAGRLDEAAAYAAPDAPPRRGVVESDVAVLRNYVGLLRLSAEERRAACEQMLTQLAAGDGPLSLSTCIFAAGHGCADRAFDVIDAALDQGRALKPDNHDGFGCARAQSSLQLFVRISGEPVWRHPRFPKLAARLGLAQHWIETKKWPDCAAQVDYDFKAACSAASAAV